MEEKDFHTILKEQMNLKSLNVTKLAAMTGIQERYLSAIAEGHPEKLPPSPYIRGYIMKLADCLNFDGEELWSLYRQRYALKTSGVHDVLPQNRFAIKTISKNKIVFGIAAIALVVYAGMQFNKLTGVPEITVTNPAAANLISTANEIFVVSGIINPRDKLFINGENVVPQENGTFNKEIQLQPGINTVEFKVSRFLGRETLVTRQILYQP